MSDSDPCEARNPAGQPICKRVATHVHEKKRGGTDVFCATHACEKCKPIEADADLRSAKATDR